MDVFPPASGDIEAQEEEWVAMPEFKSCLLGKYVEMI